MGIVITVGKLPNIFTLANCIIVYYLPSNKYFKKLDSGLNITFRIHKCMFNLQHIDSKSREQDIINGVSIPCNEHVLGTHNQNNTNNLNITLPRFRYGMDISAKKKKKEFPSLFLCIMTNSPGQTVLCLMPGLSL